VAQVALSMLLVVTAGVLVRGFDRVSSVDRGFDPRGVHVASIDLSMAGYSETTGPQFARELVERVQALPGMETATLANRPPAPSSVSNTAVTVPGVTPPNGARFFALGWTLVESGYFSALRIPLAAGRDFGPGDRDGAELVGIVSESAARRFWPGEDAIGQSITLAAVRATVRVIGVARDVDLRPSQVMRGNPLALYVPLQQHYVPQITVIVRTTGERSPAAELRNLMSSMDPDLPVLSAQPLEVQQNGPVETQLRISAGVAGSVGIVGLLLAAIGIYGVTAYTVTRRTREIGIRLSLGADRVAVIGLVLWQGMRLVAIGSVIGLAMAAGAGRLLSGTFFGVPPPDAPMLAGAAVLFAAVGFAACYVPVRRATSIRAMDALRYE
jgi:predicted permease